MDSRPSSPPLTATQFLDWSQDRADGTRYELCEGGVYAMGAERAVHARTKAAAFRQLEAAIATAGLPCEAFLDGMAVRVDDRNVFEPDALVRCGERLADNATLIEDPMIVVEVASPSTQRVDVLEKFTRYFRNPAIQHYLIVVPETRCVIHHRRTDDGRIESQSIEDGALLLSPPGLTIEVHALFAR